MNSGCRFALILIGGSLLAACGANFKDPQTVVHAEERLRQRVVDSAEVREVLTRVDDALEPLDRVMSEVQKNLDLSQLSSSEAQNAVKRFTLSKLRLSMKQASRDLLVKRDEDDAWTATRTIQWPFERSKDGQSCPETEMTFYGKTTPEKNLEIRIQVRDCANSPRELLRLTATPEKDLKVRLNSAVFTDLLTTDIRTESCSLSIDPSSVTAMTCDPMTVKLSASTTVTFKEITALGSSSTQSTRLEGDVSYRNALVGAFVASWVVGSQPTFEWKKNPESN